jgi:hypothetical protein
VIDRSKPWPIWTVPKEPGGLLASFQRYSAEAFTSGYIFVCSSHTFAECRERRLFALPGTKIREAQNCVQPTTAIFLFNFSKNELIGLYIPQGEVTRDLEKDAFTEVGSFPAQLRVRRVLDLPPLPHSSFSRFVDSHAQHHHHHHGKHDHRPNPNHFSLTLNKKQVAGLLRLFYAAQRKLGGIAFPPPERQAAQIRQQGAGKGASPTTPPGGSQLNQQLGMRRTSSAPAGGPGGGKGKGHRRGGSGGEWDEYGDGSSAMGVEDVDSAPHLQPNMTEEEAIAAAMRASLADAGGDEGMAEGGGGGQEEEEEEEGTKVEESAEQKAAKKERKAAKKARRAAEKLEKQKADEQAQAAADQAAMQKAHAKAKKEAEGQARKEADRKKKAEAEEARRRAEHEARLKEEAKKKAEADEELEKEVCAAVLLLCCCCAVCNRVAVLM